MKTSLVSKGLAALLLSVTACGQNFGATEAELTEQQFVELEGTGEVPADLAGLKPADFSPSEKVQVLAKYSHLDPKRIVPTALLQKAVEYFEANKSRFANQNYLSVIDFSKRSSKARFYVVDLKNGSVWAMRTSHGKGSDPNHDGYADSFGNVSGSNKSSLGFYRTAETYSGSHGNSLRLDGLSTTNSRARARAIVIHSASYVSERSVIQGRSLGCPAIAQANRDLLLAKIKKGSLIYAGLSGIR